MMKIQKVLMVCLGNICRSPLAHGLLESKVSSDIIVDSAGTAAYHVGNLPDSRSIDIATVYGLDITQQRARKFSKKDFQDFDLIFAMDESNYYNILSLATTDTERNKVKMILDELYPNENKSVPDPYYGGEDGFKNVYKMLDKATDKIVQNYF